MDGAKPSAAFPAVPSGHSQVFLGTGHEQSDRRTWWVVALCGAMMVLEIVGGLLFGSIALVANALHMSTHAGALLLPHSPTPKLASTPTIRDSVLARASWATWLGSRRPSSWR